MATDALLRRPLRVARLLSVEVPAAPIGLAEHLERHGPLRVAPRRAGAEQLALLDEIGRSGLTGRGGGGFPTAAKLTMIRQAGGARLLIVNATEGEPASAKDKTLLTYAPHLVLDGAEVVAGLIGATRALVALDERDAPRRAALRVALGERAARHGVRVEIGAVAVPPGYVHGEESALSNFVLTGVALPFFRPDKSKPLQRRRQRTLVQNAETLAHVALIARHGAAWFATAGDKGASGSTLVTLSGSLAHPGVFEVALGHPLGDVVGLGAPTEALQAVLVGGYGGSWVGPGALGAPYSKAGLGPHGAAPGAGVLLALGERHCGIAESARLAAYLARQGAGQCGPCVFGLPALAEDLGRLARGDADAGTLERLERRLATIAGRGGCGHPDGAVRMVKSALSVFCEDVARHRAGQPCPWASAPSLLAPAALEGPGGGR
ncbi:MAG: hypothetical protein M0004_17425 [Actinomycetota bacterium]|nr:hypothetical protein [Actinomycetota bacterium]